MKLISFIGQEKGDFPYYISSILKQENKSILVIDNSVSGDLYNSIVRDDEEFLQDRICNIENTSFVRNVMYNRETFSKFDYVICYTGRAELDETVYASDAIYVMPDYSKYSLERIKEQIEQIEARKELPTYFTIMRDLVTEKITDKAIANFTGMSEEQFVGHIELDPNDVAKYLTFNYNGRQAVKGLSQPYVAALIYVVMQITESDEKWAKKLLKKA